MIRKIFITTILALLAFQLYSQISQKQNLTLDQCIQLALKNNPGLLADKTETDIADRQLSMQKGKRLPTASLSSEYALTDQYSELNNYQTANASIQAYLPIWQNGKIKSEIEWAKLGYEAELSGFKVNQCNLIYLVNEAYVNYLRSRKLAKLAQIMSKRLSITVDAANERLKLGFSKRSDLLKAQTEYSNSIYLFTQFETSKNRAFQSLLELSGLPLDSSFAVPDSLFDYPDRLENISPDSLNNIADQYLPEFQIIEKRMDQQGLSLQIEQKKIYPEIGAFGSYNYLKTPVYKSDFYGNIGISLKMDLFTGWRKKNQIAVEKIKVDQLTWEQEDTKRLVYTEIKLARLSLSEAREKIVNAKMQMESSFESYQTINEQYLDGISSMLELIDAQYVDFRANQNYTNALADYYLAIALLKRKTGLISYEYCQ